MRVLVFTVFCLLHIPSLVSASDRCTSYKQPVRTAHVFYFGLDYPSQFGVGQLKQESGCRDVVSSDGYGSSTPAQITYSMWSKTFQKESLTSAHWTTQQAFIMKDTYDRASTKKLWIVYQRYNGGGLVEKEIAMAGVADWSKARDKCIRGVTHYKSGDISNCDINYDYSVKVFNYGNQYGNTVSTKYQYW